MVFRVGAESMANRWSFKEDYIVCKYSYEHVWKELSTEELNCLMLKLKDAGFNSRSESAIKSRVHDFQMLFIGVNSSRVPNQVRTIHQGFCSRINNPDLTKRIESYIAITYDPNAITDTAVDLFSEHDDLIHQIYKTEYASTFPMVLQKLIDIKGFKKYKEIYDKISMKQDTFSSILRGKYTEVKRENVLRLCVGLKLSIDEAEELMKSAGLCFRNGEMLDIVVKANIVNNCYDTFYIDSELCENNAPTLFALA